MHKQAVRPVVGRYNMPPPLQVEIWRVAQK